MAGGFVLTLQFTPHSAEDLKALTFLVFMVERAPLFSDDKSYPHPCQSGFEPFIQLLQLVIRTSQCLNVIIQLCTAQ